MGREPACFFHYMLPVFITTEDMFSERRRLRKKTYLHHLHNVTSYRPPLMEADHREQLYRQIQNYPYWLHRIQLDEEAFTPGFKTLDWEALELPERLDGKTFLEVGAADGMYAFEAERRGAESVVATDIWTDSQLEASRWDGVSSRKRSFDLCQKYLDSAVEGRTLPVEELSPGTVGQFDIVLCSDVLMHVSAPYTAIERLASVTDEQLIVKAPVTNVHTETPVMEFTKARDDRWNWWLPNLKCLEAMLSVAGCAETHAFHPPSNPDTAADVPAISHGQLTTTATLYRDSSLSRQIGEVDDNSNVMLLAVPSTDEGVRIHVQRSRVRLQGDNQPGDTAPIQGWVKSEAVDIGAGQSLPAKAARTLREEGLGPLISEAVSFARERLGGTTPSHGIVHGRMSDTNL